MIVKELIKVLKMQNQNKDVAIYDIENGCRYLINIGDIDASIDDVLDLNYYLNDVELYHERRINYRKE